jgi:hypothetical protein
MVAVVGMWVYALLVVIILLLLGIILFSGGGIIRRRRLSGEINSLRREIQRLQDANEALRGSVGVGTKERTESFGNLFEMVKDIEGIRCAIGGSSACQRVLIDKYGLKPGPELIERILAAQPGMDPIAKRKFADELLVGEIGRSILRSLDGGARLEKAASDAGVPVSISRAHVTILQTLGYLDIHLKLTDRGRKASA